MDGNLAKSCLVKLTCDIEDLRLCVTVVVECLKQFGAVSLSLEWRDDQHLADPWSDLIGVGVIVVHSHVAGERVHRVVARLVLLKTAKEGLSIRVKVVK